MVVICVNGYGRSALVENRVDRLVVDESGLCHALHQLARTEVFVDVQSPVDAVVVPDVKGLGGKHLVDEHVEVDLLVDGVRAPTKPCVANSITGQGDSERSLGRADCPSVARSGGRSKLGPKLSLLVL